ncbi:MAG TPA: hypothetical protein VFA27_11090 [Vicinamibacterales bacterium]|nr:hypothetical protein [Vicinamibacterales bacterium]
MSVSVDIWLRGTDFATTETIDNIPLPASGWRDEDVRRLLEGMLRAMDRRQRPGETDRAISLRGFSWIVNPFETGGVLVAIEMTLGAAIAGPFDVEQQALEATIARVIAAAAPPESTTVH